MQMFTLILDTDGHENDYAAGNDPKNERGDSDAEYENM